MGIFGNKAERADINQAVAARESESVLIDARDPKEYAAGHIPGSVNVPAGSIHMVDTEIPDLDTPVYVYCLSGARSSRAVASLQNMGYTNVKNIGGINKYKGHIEK